MELAVRPNPRPSVEATSEKMNLKEHTDHQASLIPTHCSDQWPAHEQWARALPAGVPVEHVDQEAKDGQREKRWPGETESTSKVAQSSSGELGATPWTSPRLYHGKEPKPMPTPSSSLLASAGRGTLKNHECKSRTESFNVIAGG